ncbi:hypothetical protein FRC07_005624 [Ceratobasidium sp. 392]|nr:hypothetical protein FRC07_005624 [Ceratobasidium sp. 392]
MSIIDSAEFARFLLSCKPLTGWGKSITVALSGGPDSLCLLFLLNRHITTDPSFPALRSITIDHALQPTSSASAQRTRAHALSMGVLNTILPAEWGTKPNIDGIGAAFEEAARKARYKALWGGIWGQHEDDGKTIQTLMFGHHADDQLETVIMRTMRGTGSYGMGGMRAVRRWGMGDAGLRGMRTWICRPLLGVSKERILATCDAHELSYEQDVTNFMPNLTVRNAVRHALSRPQHLSMNETIQRAIERIGILAGGTCQVEHMREYVRKMAKQVTKVDQIAVDAYLHTHARPSPPSTLLLTPPKPSVTPPPDVRSALIHRILRYVSPHPWGSPESEAGRRSKSVERIAQRVLHSNTESKAIQPFAAGAQVLWTPVAVRPDGTIRRWAHGQEGAVQGWLASRQPPLAAAARALTMEVEVSSTGTEVLWDNRFVIRVHAQETKNGLRRILIRPKGGLVLPEVIAVDENGVKEQVECKTQFIRELNAI